MKRRHTSAMRSCDPLQYTIAAASHNYSDDELLESWGSSAYSDGLHLPRHKSEAYRQHCATWSRDLIDVIPCSVTSYIESAPTRRRNASADELETEQHHLMMMTTMYSAANVDDDDNDRHVELPLMFDRHVESLLVDSVMTNSDVTHRCDFVSKWQDQQSSGQLSTCSFIPLHSRTLSGANHVTVTTSCHPQAVSVESRMTPSDNECRPVINKNHRSVVGDVSLRRANSLVGASVGASQQDEGFADGRCLDSSHRSRSTTACCQCHQDGSQLAVNASVISHSERSRKRNYRVGLNLFNKNPEVGLQYLRERNFIDQTPSSTAKFLIARKGLSRQMIGEYLGSSPTPFHSQVLRSFAQQIDLHGLEIDVALRKFQSYFRMPGEAQKIERIIEVFAAQYCSCNANVLQDTIFLLAFAIMMLNTDLHNKNVRADRKMKVDEFIRNLRGIDAGRDVDQELLSAIYERIRLEEFVPGADHVSQVLGVEHMLMGKKPPLSTALHRRLVCYCRLQEVIDPGRRQRISQHQREVFLFNDILLVAKIVGRHKTALTYSYRQMLPLTGMGVYLFEGPYYRYGICLTNTTNDKVLIMLIARNEHDRKNFVNDLKEAIFENIEMQKVEAEDLHLKTISHDQLQQSNINRYSNDSGVVDVDFIRPSELAALHRTTVSRNGWPRPHSVHNNIIGGDQGSTVSLDNSNVLNGHGHRSAQFMCVNSLH